LGYTPDFHKPFRRSNDDINKFGGKVGFIGDYEEERERYCYKLASAGIKVRVWGPNWGKKYNLKHKNLIIEDDGLWGIDYIKAICSFDINLCFLRKGNRDLHTSRSVEFLLVAALCLLKEQANINFFF